jgi:peptidyl-prolyl cis-trans isomerase SurA
MFLIKPAALVFMLIQGLMPAIAWGQSPYSAAVLINGQAVTHYEIEQRSLLLEALGSTGDLEKQAIEELIDDRLRLFAGRLFGVQIGPDEVKEGLAEYAQRSNMAPEQLIEALSAEGVEPETFTDFVKTSLIWRNVVQQKFQSKSFITEAELDTAMALGTTAVGASVLLTELILPLEPTTAQQTRELMEHLSANLNGYQEFEEAVLTYSAAASRANSGKLDWVPITSLPPDVGSAMMTMAVGQVTRPIEIPNALVIFQLRGIRDNRTSAARPIAYDYATLMIPGGRSPETLARASALAGAIDTCNDLQEEAGNYPDGSFSQQVVPIGKVSRDIGGELGNLDANEVSTNLTRGDNGEFLMFLMLCGRTNKLSEGNREDVRNALFGQRMESFGQGYLQELKGDAIILYK